MRTLVEPNEGQRRYPLEWILRAVFIGLITVLFLNMDGLVNSAWDSFNFARDHGFNYQLMRLENRELDEFHLAERIKEIVPAGSRVYAPNFDGKSRIRLRYGLYPALLEIKKVKIDCARGLASSRCNPLETTNEAQWEYVVAMQGEFQALNEGWTQKSITRDMVLWAEPGAPLQARPSERRYDSLYAIARFLFVSLACCAIGFMIHSYWSLHVSSLGLLWFLGTVFLTGLVTYGLTAWALMVFGATLGYASLLAFLLLMIISVWLRWRHRCNTLPTQGNMFMTTIGPHWLIAYCLAAVASLVIILYLVPVVCTPINSWDAMSHWMYKAKALYEHQDLSFSLDTHHNEYPILWPLYIASQLPLGNPEPDLAAKWSIALLLVVIVMQIHGACMLLRLNQVWVLLLPPLFLLVFNHPSLRYAYAEVLLLAFLTAALIALIAAEDSDQPLRWRVFAFVMLCGVAGTKYEGGPTVLVVAVAYLITRPRFWRAGRAWSEAALLVSPVLITIGWHIYQTEYGYLAEPSDLHLRDPLTYGESKSVDKEHLNQHRPDRNGLAAIRGRGTGVIIKLRQNMESWSVLPGSCRVRVSIVCTIGAFGMDVGANPRIASICRASLGFTRRSGTLYSAGLVATFGPSRYKSVNSIQMIAKNGTSNGQCWLLALPLKIIFSQDPCSRHIGNDGEKSRLALNEIHSCW